MNTTDPQLHRSAPALKRIGARFAWCLLGVALVVAGNALNGSMNDYVQDMVRQCGIAVILAVSLNIVNGLTGQFSIGHAGFMSVGAYTGASVTYFASVRLGHGQEPGFGWMIVAMLCGGGAAAVCGYLVGVPSLRLRGDYLAIVTLGFGEIIRVVLENAGDISSRLNYMGGATGFTGVDGSYMVPRLATFPVVVVAAVLVILVARNLKFSGHGLAFMSIREDEIAADAMGVNTTQIKVAAFVLAAFLAGIGGALYAHSLFFQPKTFNFILSINYVVMIVLGGTGSITGAALAGVILTALPEYLKHIQDQIHFKDEYRLVVYALMLVLMMILRPAGVFGRGELGFARLRARRKKDGGLALEDVGPTDDDRGAPRPDPVRRSDESPGPVLDIVDLTKRFGGLAAVADVNLHLNQGELVGLIGPNGAGKTTVFNLLMGVYEPTEGRLDFEGAALAGDRPYSLPQRFLLIAVDTALAGFGGWVAATIVASAIVPYAVTPSAHHLQAAIQAVGLAVGMAVSLLSAPNRRRNRPGLKPHQFARRGISRTFQNIRLFPNLTVLENVRIGAYLRRRTNLLDALLNTARLRREEVASIAHARTLLARFDLLRVQGEFAKNLPYGDQRRLEIVRALATEPRLLLLDEPAAGMNPQEKAGLMEMIRQVRDDYGLTILLIEHDMKVVMGICERIYVLDYGRIIAEGTPAVIRCNPQVIAAYLGEETPAPEPGTAAPGGPGTGEQAPVGE